MKFIILCLFFINNSIIANCQASFNQRLDFGFPASVLTSVLPTDSCYFATGIIVDSIIPNLTGSIFVKFDLSGNTLFVKTLKDTIQTYETWEGTLQSAPDGNFLVSGYSFAPSMKALLIKYSPSGDTLFTRRYVNPFSPAETFLRPMNMTLLPDGEIAIVSWAGTPTVGNSNISVIKTDSAGILKWQKTFGNNLREIPKSIVGDDEGNIIVGARRANNNLVTKNYTFQSYLFQLNPEGQKTWEYLTPTSLGLFDAANDMVLLEDGSIVVASGAGTEMERSSVNDVWFDKLLFKLSADGEIEWSKKFEEPELTGSAFTTKVIHISDNSGFLVAGTSAEELPSMNSFDIRGWIGKVTLQGDSLWTREYVVLDNNNGRHKIYDMKETPDGGFIICGEARDGSGQDSIPQRAWLLKLDAHGCLIPGCHLPNDVGEVRATEPELVIYPNPVGDYLNFQLRHAGIVKNGTIRIMDAEGRIVHSMSASIHPDETMIIPAWDWTAGIYFLQVRDDENEWLTSEKFIVSN